MGSFKQFFNEDSRVLSKRQDALQSSPYPRVGLTAYNSVAEKNTWSGDDTHYHGFNLDEEGNGITDSYGSVSGKDTHYHEVQGWKVVEANGHSHELSDKTVSDKNFKNS
jgi:hypothetical protein